MNRLQKRARMELVSAAIFCFIGLIIFPFMVARNIQGVVFLFIFLVVGVPAALIGALEQHRFEKKLDEREIAMYRDAFRWSTMVFVSYLLIFCFCVFFLVGARGLAPAWFFPGMLLSGLLIAQATQSAILFFWCDKEQSNG